MPRYSKSEFIKLAFITHQTLSTNITRTKVIPNSNNEIDTALQLNQDFLDNCIRNYQKKQLKFQDKVQESDKPKTIAVPKPPIPKPKKVTKRIISPEDEIIEREAIQRNNLDQQKLILEIEIKEQDFKIKQIQLDKLNGVLIPTELVTILFAQHSKSLTTSFHQAAEKYIVLMGKSYGVNKEEQAKMRGDLIEVINEAIKDSLEISRDGIDNIVDEYAVNGKK